MQHGSHRGQDDDQNRAGIGRQSEGASQSAGGESPTQDRKTNKREHRHLGNALTDMTEFIVPQFMGENRQNFVRRMVLQKRVEEDDAFGLSEAGEIGVAMRRTP